MQPRPRLLLIDAAAHNLESLERVFLREEFDVTTAKSAEVGLDHLRAHPIAVAVVDLMMPGMSGLDFLRAARHIAPEVSIVLVTAYGTVETAVDAMKEGAYDFITKPVKRAAVVTAVKRAAERQRLLVENRTLRAELERATPVSRIIGRAPVMRHVLETVAQAATSSATILLTGESGVGKELIAREIHTLSERAGPFVAVNMAALPEGLVESELFGHEKGAFTGAHDRHIGRFERAAHGTIFLDEIGHATPHVQARLLRVLQEREVERVGGGAPIAVDVRVVAATNLDLAGEVDAARFRSDLFYRLNVVPIRVPPLRERVEDIALLVEHFITRHAARHRRNVTGITREALDALREHSWPGNVRELENTIERAVVLTREEVIRPDDLPASIQPLATARKEAQGSPSGSLTVPLGTTLDAIELSVIRQTLAATGGDKNLAARLLGIAPRTIYRKLGEQKPEE